MSSDNADKKTITSFKTLHQDKFQEWNRDIRPLLKMFGDRGMEIYNDERSFLKKPIRSSHVKVRVKDSRTGKVQSTMKPWSFNKAQNEANFRVRLSTYSAEKKQRKKDRATLFAMFFNCMSKEVLASVRMHREEYASVEKKNDSLGLFRLMMKVCRVYSVNNVNTLVEVFQNRKWDPKSEKLSEHVARSEGDHDQLATAGKPLSDKEKVAQLVKSVRGVTDNQDIHIALHPAIAYLPDDPQYPTYHKLRTELFNLETRDPSINIVKKRRLEEAEDTDGPRSRRSFAKAMKDLSGSEMSKVLSVVVQKVDQLADRLNAQKTEQGNPGRSNNGGRGGQRGGGGKGKGNNHSQSQNRNRQDPGKRGGQAGGQDSVDNRNPPAERGGHGKGNGKANEKQISSGQCCWKCYSIFHRSAYCDSDVDVKCGECGSTGHLTRFHTAATRKPEGRSDRPKPSVRAVRATDEEAELRARFSAQSDSEDSVGVCMVRVLDQGGHAADDSSDGDTVEYHDYAGEEDQDGTMQDDELLEFERIYGQALPRADASGSSSATAEARGGPAPMRPPEKRRKPDKPHRRVHGLPGHAAAIPLPDNFSEDELAIDDEDGSDGSEDAVQPRKRQCTEERRLTGLFTMERAQARALPARPTAASAVATATSSRADATPAGRQLVAPQSVAPPLRDADDLDPHAHRGRDSGQEYAQRKLRALRTESQNGLVRKENYFDSDYQAEFAPGRRLRVPIPYFEGYEETRDLILSQSLPPAGTGAFAFHRHAAILTAVRFYHEDMNRHPVHDMPLLDQVPHQYQRIFREFYAQHWADGHDVSMAMALLVPWRTTHAYYYESPIHALPHPDDHTKRVLVQRIPLSPLGRPPRRPRWCIPFAITGPHTEYESHDSALPHSLDDYSRACRARRETAARENLNATAAMVRVGGIPTFMIPTPEAVDRDTPARHLQPWTFTFVDGSSRVYHTPHWLHAMIRPRLYPIEPEEQAMLDEEGEFPNHPSTHLEPNPREAVSDVDNLFEGFYREAERLRERHLRELEEEERPPAHGPPPPPPPPPAASSRPSVRVIDVKYPEGVLAVLRENPRADMILVDSGSSYHIEPTRSNDTVRYFPNRNLVKMTVANGQGLTVTHLADVPNLGLTVIAPDSDMAIASAHQLGEHGCTITIKHSGFVNSATSRTDPPALQRVHGRLAVLRIAHPRKSKAVYGYATKSGHYLVSRADFASLAEYDKLPTTRDYLGRNGSLELDNGAALAATAETGTPTYLTSEQQVRAYEFQLLHCARGHPSDKALILALDNGTIIGTHLTGRDVPMSRAFLGACPGCQAGKTIKPSYRSSRDEPATTVGQVLHADIFPLTSGPGENVYGGGDVALLVVDEYSGYLTLVIMADKSTAQLIKAFNSVLAAYAQFRHDTEQIHTDSESNLKHCHQHLNYLGIIHETSPPYQHSQRVERHTRTIRQRMDCMRATSPIVIESKLEGELALAAVRYINDFPTTKHPTKSPRMMVEGTKLTLDHRDKLIPFGTVAHVLNREDPETRARTAIVLGPAPMTRHSFNCYILETEKVVVRACNDIDVMTRIPDTFPGEVKKEIRNKQIAMDKAELKSIRQSVAKIPTVPLQIRRTITRASTPSTPAPPPLAQKPTRVTRSSTSSAREGDKGTSSAAEASAHANANPEEPNLDDDEYYGTEETEIQQALEAAAQARKRAEEVEAERKVNIEKKRAQMAEKYRKQQLLDTAPVMKSKAARDRLTTMVALTRTERRLLRRHWKNADKKLSLLTSMALRISVKEALGGEHAQESAEAIREEIQNMLDYKVGHYVRFRDIPVAKRRNILQSFMFLKHKTTPDGLYERTKSRMVANGATQADHMYNLVSSTTVGLASVFLMFNIATKYKCKLSSYDIKGAFLHAEFGEDDEVTYIKINKEVTKIWVEQDPSSAPFVDDRGELLLELDKFIYGLKQSPLKFQAHLSNVLLGMGYKKMHHDECMYVKHEGKHFSILAVHVDDILQVSTAEHLYKELGEGLRTAYGSITAHENAEAYLGMTIERSSCMEYLKITQKGMIQKLVEKYPAVAGDRKKYNTPAVEEIFDTHASDKCDVLNDKERSQYLGLIMTLMYLARLSRPDVLLPVTFLASRTHVSTVKDLEHAVRVIRYLEHTIDEGLIIHCDDLSITVHCDASFMVHREAGRGHTGFYVTLGASRSYVHGRSGKQKFAATSSTESEIIAALDAVKFAVWLRNLLAELQITPLSVMTLLQDNKSAIMLESNPSNKRSAHMTAKLRYVEDQIKNGSLVVEHVATELLSADLLTKPLQGQPFAGHADCMMGGRWRDKLRAPRRR